jgi:hypothetical protein
MGANNSRQDTINWNNINTNDMSSTIPNINSMPLDANILIDKLNDIKISETSQFNSKYLSDILTNNNITDTNISDTNYSSPFVTSDMYNHIMTKYQQNNMVGGANDSIDENSSTSSTSSSKLSSSSESESESESDKKQKKSQKKETTMKGWKNKQKKNKKNKHNLLSESTNNNMVFTGVRKMKNINNLKNKSNNKKNQIDNFSYVSSSAHTGGNIMNSEYSNNSSIRDENSITVSSSVRTSQINLISE